MTSLNKNLSKIILDSSSVVVLLWRLAIDYSGENGIKIQNTIVPEWYWHLSLLLLTTLGCFLYFSGRENPGILSKFLTHRGWLLGIGFFVSISLYFGTVYRLDWVIYSIKAVTTLISFILLLIIVIVSWLD